ncbi:hypothetical protein Tco_1073747, partial [Tanacetum coccineum]
RDTIQLQDVVSTISGKYLLEFTSEYGIPEGLHPELPGPEDTIMDFPEGKLGWMSFSKRPGKNTLRCYTKPLDSLKNWNNRFFWVDEKVFPTVVAWRTEMDLFNLISAPNPAKVKTGTRPRAAHEVPLLTATASRVIEIKDPVATLTSSETPSVMEKSPLDFSSEDPPPMTTNKGETKDQALAVASQEVPSAENTATAEVVLELNLEKETTAKEPPVNKRCRKRDQSAVEGNAPPNVLRKDHASVHPVQDTRGGEVSSCHRVRSSKIAVVVADPDSKNTSFTSMAGSPGSIYQPGWGVTNGCRLNTPGACQDLVDHIAPPGYFLELRHLPNDDFLSQYNINLVRQVVMGSQLRLRNCEGVGKPPRQFTGLQVRNDRLSQQVSTLQAQVTGEERIKAAFEEFKKYEDGKVEQRCAEMDARLDKLSVDFDELYPHMLTAINGRRWVIGHGLRLAVMKCAESSEIRRTFADVVFARLAKGMSEGLRYSIEHGKAGRDLVDVEAYNPESNRKLVKALQDLKDLEYPMVDELERLKDAPVERIMASLQLESDTGEDTPQWIRDLRPSSLQLKILIYPEVRDLKDPWAVKEKMLLEDVIAANKSRAEKKKKCRVVCRTHGIGSAHHPRSDGIPVSAPTVVPQGLTILVADAAT